MCFSRVGNNEVVREWRTRGARLRLEFTKQKEGFFIVDMQIFVRASLVEGKIPEWGLIEFQGSFLPRDGDSSRIYNEYIGDLNYTKDGVPFFIIGHHILYGQEVKLQKPMGVMMKNFKKDDAGEKEYLVKAVIRKKIIFKSRPKPIIANEVLKNNI